MLYVIDVGNWALPLLYLALLIDYGATFFLRTRTHSRSPWLPAVVGAHAAYLVLRAIHQGQPSLTTAQEIGSLVAWTLAAVYAVVEFTGRDRRSGVFVMLLVFLFQYTSSIFLAAGGGAAVGAAEAEGGWSRMHVLPAVVAYTALAFSAIYGVLYLAAQQGLRHHRFGVLFDRLPPLDLLGRMTWHALVIGFIFMTITIATGPLMFAGGAAGGASPLATPKILSKIITGSAAWIIYAAAIAGRLVGKWPPARTAAIAAAGFVVVLALLAASAILS